MTYQNLHSILDQQLQELYAAEFHLARELKIFIAGAISSELKSQLIINSQETEQHVSGMASLLKQRGLDAHDAKCRVIDSMLKRGSDILQSRGSDTLLDLGLVLTMRTIDTFEQCAYENARIVAEALGEDEVAKVLERHLREEGQQERSWTVLAEDMVDALVLAEAKSKRSTSEGAEGIRQ